MDRPGCESALLIHVPEAEGLVGELRRQFDSLVRNNLPSPDHILSEAEGSWSGEGQGVRHYGRVTTYW